MMCALPMPPNLVFHLVDVIRTKRTILPMIPFLWLLIGMIVMIVL